MAMVELSVMDQRYQAVMDVLRDGWRVTEVAERLGVARQSVHNWIRKFRQDGIVGLADQSHRPKTCPHQMSAETEKMVVKLRREHPHWGPRTIRHQLGIRGIDPLPDRSSVYRALVRKHLIDPNPRRKRRKDYRRWERGQSMELWQLDVMKFKLSTGRTASIVTGLDDHSRFCVCAVIVKHATSTAVCRAFGQALRRFGVPLEVLTDNGLVFTGRFAPYKTEVLFDRICRDNGIRHILTGVKAPTTTGKIERFHKTLRIEVFSKQAFATIAEAQKALDAFIDEYNNSRPHQSIGMIAPAERFKPLEHVAEPREPLPRPSRHRARMTSRLWIAPFQSRPFEESTRVDRSVWLIRVTGLATGSEDRS